MVRKPSQQPTDAELAILNVLWRHGAATVRQVHENLPSGTQIGYTTVLKTLQIMTDKGLVQRDESQRAHVYRTSRSQDNTQQGLISDLVNRAFDGSAAHLAMQALAGGQASANEIAAIRALLDRIEEDDA